jgi:hypothetical protein
MLDTKQHSAAGYIATIVVVFISIAATLFLVVNRQSVIDHIAVWQYKPSAEVATFADRVDLSEAGKFLFYASQPSLEGTQAFNAKCSRLERTTAVLGCYDGRIIYVYDVPNPTLDGIREVTAAHEMLHAAYQRLSGGDLKKVNALVEAEYEKLRNNAEFAERMAFYARTEPGERDNELHSIIGTEVASISPDLEAYYKTYFDDRSKVVALHTHYASIFASLQVRSDELSSQMTVLADAIEQESKAYNGNVNQLNTDIAAFNARAKNGTFSSQAQFNSERSALIARSTALEDQRAAINDKRTQYDKLREELSSIASESEALNRSIDSSLAPAPSL